MRENRTSGSMSGSEKPSHGRAIEALPEETGSQRIGPAYRHGARTRLYRHPCHRVKVAVPLQHHTTVLAQLAGELFTDEELTVLWRLSLTEPLDRQGLAGFDAALGGPSVQTIDGSIAGRYHVADRDVFRPLQYCSTYLLKMPDDVEWLTRAIVQMSSAHIEALVKRIGGFGFLPLGRGLREASVRRRLDPVTWDQIMRFTPVYNDAKHSFAQDKDTHLYSMADAVLAYFVCRRLAQKLYATARLRTDPVVFDRC